LNVLILTTHSTDNTNINNNSSEETEIISNINNVINAELQFFSNSKKRIDTCMNYTRPQLAVIIEPIKKGFVDARSRGVGLRYITEITADNISYCKELMTMVDELRHLDGIKGNFMISETEYLAPVVLFEKEKVASQIIYSNVKEILDQHQYMFDTLWSKAIAAQQRIREIEEEIVPIRTRLLEKQDEIIREINHLNNSAERLSICSGLGGMQMSYNYFFDSYKSIVDKYKEGKEFDRLRWIINIDKDSIKLVKIFLEIGFQIRHIKNMLPINFGVSDKELALRIEKMEGGVDVSQSFLISNEPLYVNHFNSVFEDLWRNGIDAAERIKDIEEGVDLADIEAVRSSARAQQIYLDIVRSAEEEVLWIFPTFNAYVRQDKIGAISLAKEKNVKIRILVPFNKSIEDTIQKLKSCTHENRIDKDDVVVRYIEQMSETKATILVVDRKSSLVMELRDDTKTTFVQAIGLSTYSNSKAGVLSYVAIFENLWRQAELYQQVRKSNEQLAAANEQLKVHDKMQKEFINIAAHELRTPIQPILGLTQVLRHGIKDTNQLQLMDVVIRNAKRLLRLTEDILDVTRIESNFLVLNKERINLNEVISNAINDIIANCIPFAGTKKENIRIFYEPNKNKNIVVEADRERISQVISNLLNNAVKFTPEEDGGTISTILEEGKKNVDHHQEGEGQVIVKIKDTGIGIAPEILPRLFTKFATKSEKGTGLGLFISKNIVEAHGGKMWAENNKDGKGATFTFSLPVSR
jgi:two-component system, OmpR family, sensor histidine kinase VicK